MEIATWNIDATWNRGGQIPTWMTVDRSRPSADSLLRSVRPYRETVLRGGSELQPCTQLLSLDSGRICKIGNLRIPLNYLNFKFKRPPTSFVEDRSMLPYFPL